MDMASFLEEVKAITALDAVWHNDGISGTLVFTADPSDLMKRYPQATQTTLRRASFVVMKGYMKEERAKWYAAERERYANLSWWQRLFY